MHSVSVRLTSCGSPGTAQARPVLEAGAEPLPHSCGEHLDLPTSAGSSAKVLAGTSQGASVCKDELSNCPSDSRRCLKQRFLFKCQLDVMLTESDVLIETHRAEGQSKDLINSYTLYVPKEHVFKSLLQSPESSQILPSVSLFICNISVTMVIITN